MIDAIAETTPCRHRMSNIFDQFDTPTAVGPNGDGTNPFDAVNGNIFDQLDKVAALKFANLPGNIKLNPLQQVQMQSGVADPQNTGATLASLLRGTDDVFLQSVASPIVTAGKKAYSLLSTPLTDYLPQRTAQQQAISDLHRMALAQDVSPMDDDDGTSQPSATETGIIKGIGNLANGFTSPIGLATLGLGGLPSWAQRAIAVGFAAQMVKDTPELATQLGTEFGKDPEDRDNEKIANLMTQGLGTMAMTSAAGLHGISGKRPELGPVSSIEPADLPKEATPASNAKDSFATAPDEESISQKIDDLHAAIGDIKTALMANRILPEPLEQALVETADETSADATSSQRAEGATASPAPVAPDGPMFRPPDESDLTPNQIQQSITEAINEKHAKTDTNADEDNTAQWNPNVVRRQAESAFSRVRQTEGSVLTNTAFDRDFYRTETGQRIQRLAIQTGLRVVFYKGDAHSPRGFFDPKDERLYLRTDMPETEMVASLEHELFHKRAAGGDPAALRVMAGVDPQSLAAQKIAAKYNGWLLMHGRPPLTRAKLRQEIGAFHVSGQNYEGIAPSDAFSDPVEALNAAREYHGARPVEQRSRSGEGAQFAPGKPGRLNLTQLGIKRKNPADWRATRDLWDRVGYSDILSDANRTAIARGRSPIVDEAWIRYFPEDAGLLGEQIRMHHIGGSPITIPLPVTRHLNVHMPGGFRYNPGGPGSALPFYTAASQERR